jgi:hypothetical protein
MSEFISDWRVSLIEYARISFDGARFNDAQEAQAFIQPIIETWGLFDEE